MVSLERIRRAETGWAKGILKSASHGDSGEVDRHCEKEGDGEYREAKKEGKKKSGECENKKILFFFFTMVNSSS